MSRISFLRFIMIFTSSSLLAGGRLLKKMSGCFRRVVRIPRSHPVPLTHTRYPFCYCTSLGYYTIADPGLFVQHESKLAAGNQTLISLVTLTGLSSREESSRTMWFPRRLKLGSSIRVGSRRRGARCREPSVGILSVEQRLTSGCGQQH